jgi:ATP-binding cassette subfamily A (ABC1) protein 3
MRMMGLNEFAYWCSWLLNYIIINLIIASLCTIVLFSTIFKHSSWILVWLFFFLYGLALFGFIVVVQSFFHNTNYSSIFTLVLYTSLFFVGQVVKGQYVP